MINGHRWLWPVLLLTSFFAQAILPPELLEAIKHQDHAEVVRVCRALRDNDRDLSKDQILEAIEITQGFPRSRHYFRNRIFKLEQKIVPAPQKRSSDGDVPEPKSTKIEEPNALAILAEAAFLEEKADEEQRFEQILSNLIVLQRRNKAVFNRYLDSLPISDEERLVRHLQAHHPSPHRTRSRVLCDP